MHNYLDGNYRITCDWNCHLARGSAGGTDYAMAVGTPIYASFDGELTNRPPVQYPASGNVAILTRADGIAFYHLHLSKFVNPGPVKQGNIIGYSGGAVGAPGSGQSTGPQLHINAYSGITIHDTHDYYTTSAGTSGTPITPTKERAKMNLIRRSDGEVSLLLPRNTANGFNWTRHAITLAELLEFQANGNNYVTVSDAYYNEFGTV